MNDLQVHKAIKIASLILKEGQSGLSPAEREELEQWLQEDPGNASLLAELTGESTLARAMDDLNVYDHEAAYRRVSGKLLSQSPQSMKKRATYHLWRYVAGIVLVLFAGCLLIYLTRH